MRHLIKLGAIVAGATAGAAVGVLFTTEKGAKVTDKVLNKLKSGSDVLSSSKEDLKNKLKGFISSKEESFEARLNSILDKTADKKEDLIAMLEKKLSELKNDTPQSSSKDAVQNNSTTELKEEFNKQTQENENQQEDIVLKAAHSNPTNL